MSPFRSRSLLLLVLTFAAGSGTHASDQVRPAKVEPFFGPLKTRRPQDLTRAFVQRSPDFSLQNGGNRVSPNLEGFIYDGERIEGDQLLLSARNKSCRGWAPLGSVVPFTEADEFFSQQIVRKPGDSFAYRMRGLVRFALDDRDRALADLNESLRLEPTDIAALTARAVLWLLRNRLDLALADANKAVELEPQNCYTFAQRAMIYSTVRDDENALRDIARAIDLGSQSVALYVSRGMIYWKNGNLDKAKIELQHALRIDPERTDATVWLATIQMLQSEPDKALSTVNKAIQFDPKCDMAFALRAVLARARGDDDQTLADLNEAVHLDPQNAAYIRNRGAFKFEAGEFGGALADVEAAIRLDPNDQEAHNGRAWILATCPVTKIRNGEQAVVSATRACELSKWKKSEYLYTLASAYSETGDFATAVKWQQTAIDLLSTNDPDRRDYVKLLKRYKSNKPYHRLGLLEEIGIQMPRIAATKND
jgi:tetratricopeptide (TPR) repeat protein